MVVTRLLTTRRHSGYVPFVKRGSWVVMALLVVVQPAMAFDEQALASIPLLGDPRFEIREQATRALEHAGIAAIAPLREAALGENLEITCRAIRSLAAILDTNDEATFDAAELAFEQLEASTNRSAARRAAVALASQPVRRWKRAVVRLNRLGGGVKSKSRSEAGLPGGNPDLDGNPLPSHVILGEKWSGGNAGLVNVKRLVYSLGALLYPQRMPPVPVPLPVYVIDGANVSPEALEDLQQSVPGMEIQSRGRAKLGVFWDLRSGPCTLSGVEPNSAAEKAGLRERDVIVKYDGETIDSFDQLTKITRRHNVADRIKLEVERDGEIVELEAELAGWDELEPKPKEK